MTDRLLRIIVAPSSNPRCFQGLEAYLAGGRPPRTFIEIPPAEANEFIQELQGFDASAFGFDSSRYGGPAQFAYISHTDWVSWADSELLAHENYHYRYDVHIGASRIDLWQPSPSALRYSEVKEGEHFIVTGDEENGWEWCSSGACEALGLDGGETFTDRADVLDSARDAISLASAFGAEPACKLMDDYALHLSHLDESDRRAIYAAVEVLPVDVRWHFAYAMVLNTPPMPQQYWPEHQEAS